MVISKDADFLNSHLLRGKPAKLLLVSTGNIPNPSLLGMFETHLDKIVAALRHSPFVELTRTGLIIHE